MSASIDALEALEGNATRDIEGGRLLTARLLRADERPFEALDADVPLVLEAQGGAGLDAVEAHLSRRSDAVMELLYQHGALLLRGLPVASTQDFERALFSVRALRGMHGYFMAETGRVRVPSSARIFHTNAFMKTGGTLHLGGFHSENYYSTDVPSVIAFCCHEEPWMGGETGTVHMARAYTQLGPGFKAKLEGELSCVMSWPVADVAAFYGLPEDTVEEVCREAGLEVAERSGQRHVLLHKPNVLIHPVTGLPSLHLNVSAQVRGLDEHLRQSLSAVYSGPKWSLHRLSWKNPGIAGGINDLYRVSGVLHKPKVMSALVSEFVVKPYLARRRAAKAPGDAFTPLPNACRGLDDDDARSLAAAMRRHLNVFTWRRGDILILDNLQMLHTGMPGLGSRRIEAALCNPVPLRWPVTSGALRIAPDDAYETLFERLSAQAERRRGRAPQEAASDRAS